MTQAVKDWTVVKPSGAISGATIDALKTELLDLVEGGVVNVEINLADVDIIDSKGMGLLVVCHQTLTAKDGRLRISGANEDVRGLLKVMRLDEAEKFISKLSDPGDVVCDPFLGSGTTALACKKLGRQFIGCDVDPDAVEKSRSRLTEMVLETSPEKEVLEA